LHETYAKLAADEDYPCGLDPAFVAAARDLVIDGWGSGVLVDVAGAPATVRDRERQAAYERAAAAQGDIHALIDGFVTADVRHLLNRVEAHTMVIHAGNPIVRVEQSEHLAANIADSTLVLPDARVWAWPTMDLDVSDDLDVSVEFLIGDDRRTDRRRRMLALVFSDVVGSTSTVARIGDREWADLLADLGERLEALLERCSGRLVDTAGDGYFSVFHSSEHAVSFATRFRTLARDMGLRLRSGVHVGECQIDRAGQVRGLAVHAAARVAATAQPDEVLVTATVRELLRDAAWGFADRGAHELRGLSGTWELSAIST
jgi:class 3 adenylate cyclase